MHSCLKHPSPQESSEHIALAQVSGCVSNISTCRGESHLKELVWTRVAVSPTPIRALQLEDHWSSEIPRLAVGWKIFHQAV